MTKVNNVFTDLFDTFLDSPYEGLMIDSNGTPQLWTGSKKKEISECEKMSQDEFVYDLEALGISIDASFEAPKTFILFDYEGEDKTVTRFRIRYQLWGTSFRLFVYKPGVSIP